MAYNSAYTGAQIDSAVGAVAQKEILWDAKQDKALLRQITLPKASWDASTKQQTIAVEGVVADQDAQAIFIEYSAAGITAVAGDGILTFTANKAQDADVVAKVAIMAAEI